MLDLQLLFSSIKDGYHLKTMLEKCVDLEPQFLIIQTMNAQIFGAFLSEAWDKSPGKGKFFGTSESSTSNHKLTFSSAFLFALEPDAGKYPWIGQNAQPQQDQCEETRLNSSLFMLSDINYIAVGGGGC